MNMGPVKRFVVFAYAEFYPGGGWHDVDSSHDTLEEARAKVDELDPSLHHPVDIVDLQTGEIVNECP